MKEIVLVAALAKNRVIGKDGALPWDLPGDRAYFARVTKDSPVLMGRKTYESIVSAIGKPLKNRRNIVLTRNNAFDAGFPEVSVIHSFEEALGMVGNEEQMFVIGGAEIYALALPYAHLLVLTHVDAECAGDTFFPEWNRAEWKQIYADQQGFHKARPEDEYPYRVAWYQRKSAPPLVDLENARLPEQRAAMEGITARGHCPFCPRNLPPEHTQPIEKDGAYWFVTKSQWPHKNAKLNLLFILKRHTESLKDLAKDLKPEEAIELYSLLAWAEEKYDILGGGIGMRFGNTDFSSATVRHLHVHLLVPDRDNPDYAPVRFKIGKDKG